MEKSIKLYETEMHTLFSLPDKQRGRVLTALLAERLGESIPELDPMEQAVFSLISAQVKRAEELSQKRKGSAEKRWNGGSDNMQNHANENTSNANGMQNHANEKNCNANSCTNTNTNTNTNTRNTPLPPQGKETDGFSEFWQAYPKKTAKQTALKAWKKLKPDGELLKIILNALEQQKQSVQWQKEGGQFIPYPATWLNGKRWEDAPEQAVQAPPVHEFDPDDPYKDWK